MRTLIPILLIVLAAGCKAKDSGTLSQTDTTAASSTTTTTGTETPISSTETAVAPEVNPPGDIPDTQAFVKYSNTAGGYSTGSSGRLGANGEGWRRNVRQQIRRGQRRRHTRCRRTDRGQRASE